MPLLSLLVSFLLLDSGSLKKEKNWFFPKAARYHKSESVHFSFIVIYYQRIFLLKQMSRSLDVYYIFLMKESESESHLVLTLSDPMDYRVHGILQVRILK